ncbi:MAG: DUF6600 domain-containing protein [Bryobacteraceae bacterium]|jgi:hypothetical protein
MMRKVELLAALLAMAAAPVLADAGDPPSRVARLSYQSGTVSFRPGTVEEWTAATVNYPLTTGDHLWADAGAQVEMHVGSTAIRMGSQTALAILNLDDQMAQLSLTQGVLDVHIRYLGDQEAFEIDTPNVAVSLLRPGDYRIDVDGDNNITTVTVRGGEAEVTGGGAAFSVHADESARLSGVDTVSQDMGSAPPRDEFDRWCEMRDRREDQSQSVRYVSREMIGYEDLDKYGAWRDIPPYGWVWAPAQMAVGWAPYRYGHWVWVDPWGWTWIDDAPWGFAPFHYGRWAFAGAAWVWVPGAMAARQVYAPALVAFVGFGGVGMAAWFPLGPGEVYRPAYHVSEVYVRQVNIAHVTNVAVINNVTNVRYVNQGVVGAVTVVPRDAFVGARAVARAMVVAPQREIMQAQVVGSTAPIAPVRESVLARPVGAAAVRTPPARIADRAVFAKTAPPPPPVSRVESLRATDHVARPAVVRGPGAGVARPERPAVVPPRNDRPPAVQAPQARPESPLILRKEAAPENRPTARPAEQPRAERPAQVQERKAAEPKAEKKAVKKTEKKEERKDNR